MNKYTTNTNWKDVWERAIWTGVQVVVGYLSADVILAVLDQWGVDVPDRWLVPLTVALSFGLSVLKNVVLQYRQTTELEADVVPLEVDDTVLPPVEADEVVSVEDAFSLTEAPVEEEPQ